MSTKNASARKGPTAPTEAFRLTLVSFPPDRKARIIAAVRGITGLDLKAATALVGTLPAVVKEFDNEDTAGDAHKAMAAADAHCLLHHLEDGKICGEDVGDGEQRHAAGAPSLPSQLEGIDERTLLDVIEEQRARLSGIRDVLDCARAAVDFNPSAIEGAVGLSVAALLDAIDALDEVNLLRAAREATRAREELPPGDTHESAFLGEDGEPMRGAPAPLPCPFCGSTSVEVFTDEQDALPSTTAQCANCGSSTGPFTPDGDRIVTERDCALAAARAWNLREAK